MEKIESHIYWYNRKLGNDYNRNEIAREIVLILLKPLDFMADLFKFFILILNKLPLKKDKPRRLHYITLCCLGKGYMYFDDTLAQKLVDFLNWFFQIPPKYC